MARADEAAPYTAAGEIRELVRRMEEAHPDLYRSVSRADFHGTADALVAKLPELSRDQAVVGVMKLVALAGARDGHTAVFPMADTNPRAFHVYPLQLYRFADGLFVIRAAGSADLVGARLAAVQGVPLAEVEALVAPTVARDNDWDLAARLPLYLLTAEVLHGLGVTATADSATFTFEGPAGGARSRWNPRRCPRTSGRSRIPSDWSPRARCRSRASRATCGSPTSSAGGDHPARARRLRGVQRDADGLGSRSRDRAPALATEPDVRVELTSADYFAGRDPVLEAAVR